MARIEVVSLCEHGEERWHWVRAAPGVETTCSGGSRRVLDPGSIPDHVIEAAAAELTLDDYACQDDPEGGLDMVRRSLRAALDALAGGEQP